MKPDSIFGSLKTKRYHMTLSLKKKLVLITVVSIPRNKYNTVVTHYRDQDMHFMIRDNEETQVQILTEPCSLFAVPLHPSQSTVINDLRRPELGLE